MNAKSTMEAITKDTSPRTTVNSWRRIAWILMLLAEVGLLAWGAMAAIAPEHLLGPKSTPILTAEYENFTGYSWSEFTTATPNAVNFLTLVFRMYGIYGVGFSLMAISITVKAFRRGDHWAWWALLVGNTLTYVSAMVYDQIARAVGPFEVTEYLGLAAVYLALAVTVPWKRQNG